MLVLSRKKSEAILIDGKIRIEVVNVGKATVRVRLTAPRGLQLAQGTARIPVRERDTSPCRAAPVGMDLFHMTLVNQQVVPLGETVSLGVVDADKSRVLFVVDAPPGTSITAVDPERLDQGRASSNQILLQFMSQNSERRCDPLGKPASTTPQRECESAADETGPDLLRFPSNHEREQRS